MTRPPVTIPEDIIERRELLKQYADEFLDIINTPNLQESRLRSLVAEDLVTPLTYPGALSGYEGVKATIGKLHGSLSNYAMKLLSPAIDEIGSTVVYFVTSSGVQTGEWRGFPGSGKAFDHFGFVMMKIDLERRLIVEINILFQEILWLKQIGVVPYGYS